jgi:hypothetical protein
MNNSLTNVSVRQLERAIKIKAKLETLQAQLDEVLGGDGTEIPSPFRKKRRMSAAGRAAIAAGARRRWAKIKGEATAPAAAKKPRRKMSAAAKARMSAVAKERWKKAKAAGKTTL